ncbi:ATP-grasp domain-containing protein [Micromonospora sp. 050-3]|uniref:ATP-grasp domain-containing protein n=1 Tax=Micromonospora sp. 050-3 TaxID=2789265 RepID=UPI00397985CF
MILIVPANPLRPRRPDEHFTAEAEAARAAGFQVAVVDHDALARGGDVHRAEASVSGSGAAVYRGVVWRTSGEQYRRAHELPGWYAALAAATSVSVWTQGSDQADLDHARVELGAGPAVLRDYTKSMKHYWNDAAFIPELGDAVAVWRVAIRSLELREDDFVGGFVLRRFERFTSAEVRTWWVNGDCVLIGPHPDTPNDCPSAEIDLEPVAPMVAGLGLPFVTVDLALRADGVWRVIELGDGQVSDLPTTVEPEGMIAALLGPPRP